MKKTILATLLCLGFATSAFAADNSFEFRGVQAANTVVPTNTVNTPDGVVYTQYQVPPDMYPGRPVGPNDIYGLQVKVEVNDQVARVYDIPSSEVNKFVVISGEEVPYVSNFHRNGSDYKVAQNGLVIKGKTKLESPYVLVNMRAFYNDLYGFDKSCARWKKDCIELPQEILSQSEILAKAAYLQEIRSNTFTTVGGDRVVVKFTVVPIELRP